MSDIVTERAEIFFRGYDPADFSICLAIFDANCPAYFAPNERANYVAFLEKHSSDYHVCLCSERIVGAFGISSTKESNRAPLRWIMLDPVQHGRGTGAMMMRQAVDIARGEGASHLDIGASQYSAGFFARFGAVENAMTDNGWGPGMHRIDMILELASVTAARLDAQ